MSSDRDESRPAAEANSSRLRRRARPGSGPEPSAAQRALGLLVRREHSRKELLQKLANRGVPVEEASTAVDKLSQAGWQDDARFAEFLARSRAHAGQGPRRIRAELELHGLDADAIALAMTSEDGETGFDWAAQAREIVRRRYPAALAGDRAAQRKAAEFLLRRGFAMEQVRAAMRLDPDDAT